MLEPSEEGLKPVLRLTSKLSCILVNQLFVLERFQFFHSTQFDTKYQCNTHPNESGISSVLHQHLKSGSTDGVATIDPPHSSPSFDMFGLYTTFDCGYVHIKLSCERYYDLVEYRRAVKKFKIPTRR